MLLEEMRNEGYAHIEIFESYYRELLLIKGAGVAIFRCPSK